MIVNNIQEVLVVVDTLSILSNVNVNGSVTFKSDNSISTDLKKYATTKLG